MLGSRGGREANGGRGGEAGAEGLGTRPPPRYAISTKSPLRLFLTVAIGPVKARPGMDIFGPGQARDAWWAVIFTF